MQRFVYYTLIVAISFASCSDNYPEGALIINKTDTLYDEDILAVSEKINLDPNNPENYYLRANAFFYQGNFDLAIRDFETSLLINPKNPVYRYRLAETLLQKDSADYLSASKQLSEALLIKRDYHEAKYLLAKLHLARQQYPDAEKLLEELVNQNDFKIKAKLLQVVSYKEQRDTLKSVKILDEILIEDPNNYDATMQKALFLLDKDVNLSMQFVDKALAIDEFSAEAMYTKALIFQRQTRYADAEILYQRVIKINPSHIFAHYNLAVIQALFDNHASVIDLCGKILDLDPNHYKALVLRGFAFESQGNKKAARSDYQAALEIAPNYEPAKKYLSELI